VLGETDSIKGLQANLPVACSALPEDRRASPFLHLCFLNYRLSFCFWIAKILSSLWRNLCRPFDPSGSFSLSVTFPGTSGIRICYKLDCFLFCSGSVYAGCHVSFMHTVYTSIYTALILTNRLLLRAIKKNTVSVRSAKSCLCQISLQGVSCSQMLSQSNVGTTVYHYPWS